MTISRATFDLAVVGAGILGLSCALAAARRKLKVVVIERSPLAQGASVRNFGLISVTGQDPDTIWPLARRTRDVWEEMAAKAGIAILQRGVWIPAQRLESAAVLEAFIRTETAEGCELLSAAAALSRCPELQTRGLQAVLWSPHDLRVESRAAIPALASWLAREHGVTFLWETAVREADAPVVQTSRGPVAAGMVVVCPGDDLETLFPEQIKAAGISRCTLQMLRLESPGFVLPGTLMSDLSLVRYGGFAELPEAAILRRRLLQDQPEYFQHGIHLLVAQGGDGRLVVGDSHHYGAAPVVFAEERVAELLLEEYRAVTGHLAPAIRERWMGSYAVAAGRAVLIEAPAPRTRLVMVTSGIG
ncbi:MAG TPA: TIGR03364 family FAD-dependent oxidoreductase, partial [Steroidobacteraceae bacterium]|nr:TIGR03364 family FAD-dependent oxidoreductase [Steroidobacteraceae bacterium]